MLNESNSARYRNWTEWQAAKWAHAKGASEAAVNGAVMTFTAGVAAATGSEGESEGKGSEVSYPFSMGLLFYHYLSSQGGSVSLPLSDIDEGLGASDFPEFWNATAVVLPGETATIGPLLYRYFQGYSQAGQVSLVLEGTVARDQRGFISFAGEVRGLESFYNFNPLGPGGRTPWQEKATTLGRALKRFGAEDFRLRYVGSRRVTFEGWQE